MMQTPQTLPALVTGPEHVPIAVRDLDGAAKRYEAMGFALKPGTSHANGIRNLHAKFADGTEIELITAPKAVDALTTTYVRHLSVGDGPAFLALFARDVADVNARYPSSRRPSYWFFGAGNFSPTDKPEHFTHRNTATSLVSVWLAGADLSRERALLAALGARMARGPAAVPDVSDAEIATFDRGTIVLLPAGRQVAASRPIVGLTIAVDNIATTMTFLAGAGIRRAGNSAFVPPDAGLGYWLEFRQR